MAMEINRKTKAALIAKAEQDCLQLQANRRDLTKVQEETKEKYKGEIVNVPISDLFEMTQIMNHYVKYSRRSPNRKPLSVARLLHYGIKMEYSDNLMNKDTTVKKASFNGAGQIVSLLKDSSPNDDRYMQDLSLLFEPGIIES